MTIYINGYDVTDEVHTKALELARLERVRTNNFGECVVYLIKARAYLNSLPVPWQNDCISNSIDAIDYIIKDLNK